MKAITNYIAAVITAAMIFTSVAFFITSTLRQVEISNYALNTMVQLSDRAREVLGIGYVFNANTIVLTIVNAGGIDVGLNHVVFIDKNLSVYKVNVNSTTIPIGSIVNLEIPLPTSSSNIYSIKITTSRGNVFDVLSATYKPIDVIAYVNITRSSVNDRFEVTIYIRNSIPRSLLLSYSDLHISFINHVSGSNVTRYFTLKQVYPSETILLKPGEQVVYHYVYEYSGGLTADTPIDITIFIDTETDTLETIYSSTTLSYAFLIQ